MLVMIHSFQLLFIECDYPKAFCGWIGMHAVMFYFLFSDYYKQEYAKKEARRQVRREALATALLKRAAVEPDGPAGSLQPVAPCPARSMSQSTQNGFGKKARTVATTSRNRAERA